MQEAFLKVVNMSISAGWIVLAVILLRFLLKKAPKSIHCILWALVAIRLLCPFSPESVLSLIPSAETVSTTADSVPVIRSGFDAVDASANEYLTRYYAPTTSGTAAVDTADILPFIWLAGIGVMLLYAVFSYVRLYRRVRASMRLRDNLWICDAVSTPFILGIIRPRIYFPSGMDGEQLGFVTAHELAHLRRRDHWWKPLGFVLLCVYWFNPAIWLAYILLCRDIELACDECVVRELSVEERCAYSQSLLDCSAPRRLTAVYPLAFGEVGVKDRVKKVLNYRKPAFWLILIAILACIASAICFLTNPPTEEQMELPPVYPQEYGVVEVTYGKAELLDAPVYRISEGMQLSSCGECGDDWTELGTLAEYSLTKANFDRLFSENSHWTLHESASEIRKANAKTWRLMYGDRLYYLLQQKNGELFLVGGYYDSEGETDPNSDDSNLSWLYRLAIHESENAVAALTLDDVLRLSQKAEKLTWADFDGYSYEEAGFGLYIRIYPIDGLFSVWAAGTDDSADKELFYVHLVAQDGTDTHTDLQGGDVQAFIEEHRSNPPAADRYGSWVCCPVQDSEKLERQFSKLRSHLRLRTDVGAYAPIIRIGSLQELENLKAEMEYLPIEKSVKDYPDMETLSGELSTYGADFFERHALYLVYFGRKALDVYGAERVSELKIASFFDIGHFETEEKAAVPWVVCFSVSDEWDRKIMSGKDTEIFVYDARDLQLNAWDRKSPPPLEVMTRKQSVEAFRGGFSWKYGFTGKNADCAHPLDLDEEIPYLTAEIGPLPGITAYPDGISFMKSNTVFLQFPETPDAVAVTCWSDAYWHVYDAPQETVEVILSPDGVYTFDMKAGGHIYDIEVQWNNSVLWGGNVHYYFYGNFSVPDMMPGIIEYR